MNQLATLIQSKGWTSDDVKANLQAEVVIKQDATLYTQKYLPNILTDEELGIAATVLKQASDADPVVWLFVQSLATGIDFSSPATVKFLTNLFSGFPTILEKLQAIGVVKAQEWTNHFDKEPTDDEIKAAFEQIALFEKATYIQQLCQAAINGEQTDIAALKQLIAES